MQAGSADLVLAGAVGIGVVSLEAFTAGVASMPGPFSDADWGGWMVWRSFAYKFDVTTDVGRLLLSWEFEVDSKAMRKMGSNETMVVLVESQTGAFQAFDGTRTLVKLG